MHGRFVVHPVSGRRIPIVCDAELVDMSFGTGAVKVGRRGVGAGGPVAAESCSGWGRGRRGGR
jgi:hypothetical protein